jgi:hypothetical protein
MKKILLSAVLISVFYSCQKEDQSFSNSETTVLQRKCATTEVLERQLSENPEIAIKMNQIEVFTKNTSHHENRLVNGSIEVPVVVNLLYRTNSENISDAQIQSQIDVLNEDFNAQNSDYNQVPSLFSDVKADVGITFVLETVNRKKTKKRSWGTRDAMKNGKRGGIYATSPETKLNFWVCTIGSGILGYAQFPGGSPATDGIVVDSRFVGVTSDNGSSYPYNLGRTTTHEVGHWLNLRHIWGDSTCGNDFAEDTPLHNTANYGDPTFPHYSSCTGNPVEMTMNYMDYTDDRGMYMFSNDQKARIEALFVPGGARYAFSQP